MIILRCSLPTCSVDSQIRNALNVAALFAFLWYVGAGLSGTAGLGDYNLGLDDSYQGQIVKGCPAYEEVRQPSMNDFDIQKYEGKWYEHKFHDWTQFKEVYDTTLDIKVRIVICVCVCLSHWRRKLIVSCLHLLADGRRKRVDRRLWCPWARPQHCASILGQEPSGERCALLFIWPSGPQGPSWCPSRKGIRR